MTEKYNLIEKASDLSSEAFSFLSLLDQNYFPTPWTTNDWADLFNLAGRFLLLMENEKEVTGFVLFDTSSADSFAHLLKIVLNPNKRGHGFGKNLLNESIRILKGRGIRSFFLEVEENNSVAIKLYQSIGFKIIHQKKQFYSSGATALIMTLDA